MAEQANTRQQVEAVLQGRSPQKNYRQAYQLALERARQAGPQDLDRLAVVRSSPVCLSVPSLGTSFGVDLDAGTVTDAAGARASVAWAILVLHYISARPSRYRRDSERYISFMDIPEARGYAKPYNARVIGRFLHTAGRDQTTFCGAARQLDGRPVDMPDAAFEFAVFLRARVQVIWYRGDEALGPGASFSFDPQVPDIFCVEDIVVMAELLVGGLSAAAASSRKPK